MHDNIELVVRGETFPVAGRFTIARGSRTEQHVVHVRLRRGEYQGQAECVPYARYGETVQGVVDTIESYAAALARGASREALQAALPAGAARNGLDCALWDLEAKRCGLPVWQLAGLGEPGPLTTAYTLSLDSPDAMFAAASREAWRPLLKLKLGGGGEDIERLAAVHDAAPDSTLIVDANEAWSAEDYDRLAPRLLEFGVVMVEQPLPADSDDALLGRERPLPVCADESVHALDSLDRLAGKYDVINIKIDKTGGLTEALRLKAAASDAGLEVMIGCMLGTSLAMAPALLLGQGVRYVDLDGPLLLAHDREPSIRYEGSTVLPAVPALWG